MADFGRGRSYPITEKEEVVVPDSTLGTERTGKVEILNPNYPELLRYFLRAMIMESFDGHDGRRKGLHSILDITRYLAHTNPGELAKIMEEYS